MVEESIWIVTRDSVEDSPLREGQKGWGRDLAQKAASAFVACPVNAEKIQKEWLRTLRFIGQLIHQAEEEAGGEFDMQLDEVTLAVEIDSKGKVGLIGTCSGEANGKGAITLKFKRAAQT
ncbi:MAG: hypothetical protein AAFV85_21255 [Cyanobacteria bacterium J06634_6]